MNIRRWLRVAGAMATLSALPATGWFAFLAAPGVPARWFAVDVPVDYVIQIAGSDDMADESEDLAIRRAFQAWEDVSGASLTFSEDTDPVQRARTDFVDSELGPNDIHLVFFDEDRSSGLFSDPFTIAVTQLWFFQSNGRMADADLAFNGEAFTFSTDLSAGTLDVGTIATHEIGHFVGLHHSGLGGATMAPFATFKQFTPRTLSTDDRAGLRALYPDAAFGSISGTVTQPSAGGRLVGGAHVWVRSTADGRVASATLTDSSGDYTLNGLAAGDYRVVVAPLEGAVTWINLAGSGGATIDTDFAPAGLGPVTVTGSAATTSADVAVGADATPRVDTPATTMTSHPGETVGWTLTGAGLTGATVSVPDAGSAFVFLDDGAPSISFSVDGAALPGLYDLKVTAPGGALAYHPGFLEVLPPAPSLSGVLPAAGSAAGGTQVTLSGGNFAGTPDVLFGDAEGTGVVVTSPTSLTVTAPAQDDSPVDVVLVDVVGGDEARLAAAFSYGLQPTLASVYPAAGSTSGGTALTLVGSSFDPAATVAFGTTPAAAATWVSATRLDVTTPALGAGAHDVTATNPAGLGSVLSPGFTAAAVPDPAVSGVDPAFVSHLGGDEITVSGTGFASGVSTELFVDLTDGSGGVAATTQFVSASELSVVAPAADPGSASLVVTHPSGPSGALADALQVVPQMTGRDRFTGSISDGADTDRVLLECLAGTLLTATAQRLKGSTLEPALALLDAAGTTLVSSDPADPAYDEDFALWNLKRARIRRFPLPATARYSLVISARATSAGSGAYRLSARERIPKAVRRIRLTKKAPTAVGPGDADLAFVAKRGSLLSGKISARDGLLALVSALTGPQGSLLGDPAVDDTITVLNGGKAIRLRRLPLDDFGAHMLSIGADSLTSGTIVGGLTIRPPRSRVLFVE